MDVSLFSAGGRVLMSYEMISRLEQKVKFKYEKTTETLDPV